jgi:hypothetical protein
MSESALSAAMDQAAAAAESAPTNQGQVAAYQGGGSVAPIARPSLDDMADNSGIKVDAYLTLKFEGMKIGNSKLFDDFEAILDVTEAVPIVQVRANRQGNTTFIKSYDGVSTSTGENFQQKIAHLQATNDKVDGPYNTVELPFELTKALPGTDLKAGDRVGVTPPMTGTDEWNSFYKSLRDQGLNKAKVKVRVFHIPRTNRNNNEWGICGYELLGEVKS